MEDFNCFSDEQLQQLAVSGNSEAEDALAVRYNRLVRKLARPLFLAGGDSEDLMQEGMLGLLSAIRNYDASKPVLFKTFADVCIRRRLISAIKSAKSLKHFPLNSGVSLEDAFSEDGTYRALDLRQTPEEQVLARERANEFSQKLTNCMSQLERKILPYYLQGYSYGSIAEECGCTEKAVDNAVQRIRRKLSRILTSGDSSES